MNPSIDWLLRTFSERDEHPFMLGDGATYSYRWLADQISGVESRLEIEGCPPGTVVALRGDYTPHCYRSAAGPDPTRCDHRAPVTERGCAGHEVHAHRGSAGGRDAACDPVPLDRTNRSHTIEYPVVASDPHGPGQASFSIAPARPDNARRRSTTSHCCLKNSGKPRRALTTLAFLMIDHIAASTRCSPCCQAESTVGGHLRTKSGPRVRTD